MILKINKEKTIGELGVLESEIIGNVSRAHVYFDAAKQMFLKIVFENDKPNEHIRLTRIPNEEDECTIDCRPSEGYTIYLMNDKGQTIERIM